MTSATDEVRAPGQAANLRLRADAAVALALLAYFLFPLMCLADVPVALTAVGLGGWAWWSSRREPGPDPVGYRARTARRGAVAVLLGLVPLTFWGVLFLSAALRSGH